MPPEPKQQAPQSTHASGTATSGPQPTPGKSSLAGADATTAGPQWEAAKATIDPEDDHTKPPPEFKALNPDVINLLDHSRFTMTLFKGKKFWPAMHELGVANLHTLVQIHKFAKPAGLWVSSLARDQATWRGNRRRTHASGRVAAMQRRGQEPSRRLLRMFRPAAGGRRWRRRATEVSP